MPVTNPIIPGMPLQIIPPALPERSEVSRYEGPQLTEKTRTADPRVEDAQAAIDAAQRSQDIADQQKHEADTAILQKQAEEADKKRAAVEAAELRRQQARAEADQAIAARMAEDDRRRAAMEQASKGRATSYWDNPGAPSRVLSALLTGLGNIGNRMAGGNGVGIASVALERELAQDRASKLAKFEDSMEFRRLAKEDLAAAQAAKAAKLKEIDDQQEVQIRNIEASMAPVVAKLKIPQAQAAFDQLRATNQEKRAEDRRKAYQTYDTEHTLTGPQRSHTTTVNTGGAAKAPEQVKNAVFGVDGQVIGVASDEVTARLMKGKVAAYAKVRALTERLSNVNADAPAGSKEREQAAKDLEELVTNIAIMNNNEGKPSDSDIANARKQVGTTFGLSLRAGAAKLLDKPGLDPRTGWKIIHERAKEKMKADLDAQLGPNQIPGAIDTISGPTGKPADDKPKGKGGDMQLGEDGNWYEWVNGQFERVK
jgi:hypothetical protein